MIVPPFSNQAGQYMPVFPDLVPDRLIVTFLSNSNVEYRAVYSNSMRNCFFNANLFIDQLMLAGKLISVEALIYSKFNGTL